MNFSEITTGMTLGELIKELYEMPQNAEIIIDENVFKNCPYYDEENEMPKTNVSLSKKFFSYRGNYYDLAIGVKFDNEENVTVKDFITALRNDALFRTFQGYKGGDFYMDEDTLVWLERYPNECRGIIVLGVCKISEEVVLLVSKNTKDD